MVELKAKGQIAFESLLVLLVVITLAVLFTTMYTQIHDETLAIGYARTETLSQIASQNSDSIIEKVYIQKTQISSKIIIVLNTPTQIDTEKIKSIIETKTNLRNFQIDVNVIRQ